MSPSWTCAQGCDGETGDNWATIDKAAERHTKTTGHSTVTSVVGSRRERDADGRVRNVRPGGGT